MVMKDVSFLKSSSIQLFIGLFAAILFTVFSADEVNALSLGYPTQTFKYVSPSSESSSKANLQDWWGEEFYTSSGYLGNPGSTSSIGTEFISEWSNANLCLGKNILITGYVGGLTGFFDERYSIKAYNSSAEMNCSTELVSNSKMKYTCSGVGGGTFTLIVYQNSFRSNYYYTMGVSKAVNISCDSSNSDIITNNNNNTQNIINNQNNNTQEIINNQNSNSQKEQDAINNVNDSITDSNIDDSSNTANSFFDGFSSKDHGGISSIITSPLVAINKMLDTSCTDMSVTWEGQKISLPCGYTFWDKLNEIKTFINVIEGGALAYWIVLDIRKMIDNFKNPDNNKVEVMEL